MSTKMEGSVIMVKEGEPEVLYRLRLVRILREPCLQCGQLVDEGEKICPNCGLNLVAASYI
ncbi:MAG: hypothetical protein LiPW39_92 [Parcubacteria group bacterium LiPW_39]|nr:MAG: hypothetical protein LiPW39_92 [Parcubacteria group bacterium LiPW_39]